ncbi:MAG: CRISPR-associated endonuclease Cas1 [Methylococcales bacterium]|nr:CRISPR-associated endonuclease Cas1 [Methylococcales bacterium]
MKTLFVEKKGMELRYERACLLIFYQGKRVSSVPLCQLDRIVVSPHITLTAGVLGLVTEKEVALIVINSRYPGRTAVLSASSLGNVQRRIQQYQLHQNQTFRLHWAKFLVHIKILRQYRLLYSAQQSRPDLRQPLTKAIRQLATILGSWKDDQTIQSLTTLRGKEGAAAAIYFNAFKQLFSPALNFTNRNRRPPKDPVNVCLSLTYTLFYHEAAQALKISGLDPALGCLHEIYYNRDSLACDLLEPLRPLLDRWIYDLFKSSVLRAEDFSIDNGCLFNPAGKKRFYDAFRQVRPTFKRLLRYYARFVVTAINQQYAPA